MTTVIPLFTFCVFGWRQIICRAHRAVGDLSREGGAIRRLSLATSLILRFSLGTALGSLALIVFLSASADAAMLNIDGGGQLLGAFNVNVGGDLCDVEFLDGTCIALFEGCASVADLTSNNSVDAQMMSAVTATIRTVILLSPGREDHAGPSKCDRKHAGIPVRSRTTFDFRTSPVTDHAERMCTWILRSCVLSTQG
jgi:hypothetical protein